jgi:type II secretory pathway component PulF
VPRRITVRFRTGIKVRDAMMQRRARRKVFKLCEALAHLLLHGFSLHTALQYLLQVHRDIGSQRLLLHAGGAVASGRTLSESWRDYLAPTYLTVLRAGEEAGSLGTALQLCHQYEREQVERRERVIRSLSYPFILTSVLLALICIISFVMVPVYASMYTSMGIPMPTETRVIFDFLTSAPSILIFIFTLLVIGSLSLVLVRRFHPLIWRFLAPRLPFYQLLWMGRTERLCRVLYMFIDSGIPIVNAVHALAHDHGPQWLRSRLAEIHVRLMRGEKLSDALGSAEWNPLLFLGVALAEGTGDIKWVLKRCGLQLQTELAHQVDVWMKRVEPVLLIAVGTVVTLVMLGVFVPMYDLASSLSTGNFQSGGTSHAEKTAS